MTMALLQVSSGIKNEEREREREREKQRATEPQNSI